MSVSTAPKAGPSQPSQSAKRSRKRRRRQASYSASSSSDSSSDEDGDHDVKMKTPGARGVSASSSSSPSSSSSSSASSSSSSSSSPSSGSDSESDSSSDSDSSESSDGRSGGKGKAAIIGSSLLTEIPTVRDRQRHMSNSPTPPPSIIPSFLPPSTASSGAGPEGDNERRTRFRRVYMEKLVEGFGSELDKLRTSDPTMNPARIQLLVDAIQSGVDVFNDPSWLGKGGSTSSAQGVDEVALILGDSK